MHIRTTLVVFLSSVALTRADVAPAPLFTDHAVLQQNKPIPVWGIARPGENVSVEFQSEIVQTRAGPDGRWRVDLKARRADVQPADLKITGDNTIVLHDVLVGEVWLAMGQSNMEFKLKSSAGGDEAVASASQPLIRHIRLAHQVSNQPLDTSTGQWEVSSPQKAANFTAVGYYFAREVFESIKTPIGIIHNSWGGTPIESWMSAESLASNPDFRIVGERWAKVVAEYPAKKRKYDAELADWTNERTVAQKEGRTFDKPKPNEPGGPGHKYTPSGLYNGMVYPLVPYAIRGVVWYQGENNGRNGREYRKLFPAMIRGWRAAFGQGDFPFYWVQLANYNPPSGGRDSWAWLREAQDMTLSLPNTGQALAIDVGDAHNIHPLDKRTVGHRLALIALAKTYLQPVEFSGPRFESADLQRGAIRVGFTHAAGLHARGGPPKAFEVAGNDRRFFAADAQIEGDCIVVSSPEVLEPVAVRFAWSNCPQVEVYNGAGLPLAPFRSDSW